MIHLWIGNAIRAADETHENWLTEGFTDYLSYQIMLMAHFMSRPELLSQYEEESKKYVAQAGHVSMRDAGENKQENYDLIYSGGFLVAVALESEINKATSGKNNFQTMIRKLYQQYGVTAKPYSFENVVQLASQEAGVNLSPFFNSYVKGTRIIHLVDFLPQEAKRP